MSPFPPIEALIPHAGPMRLLDRVLSHDERTTRCAARPEGSALFRDEAGEVPAWLALELMAQCAAVHGGLARRARGEPARAGLLVGARHLRLAAERLPREPLEVRVTHLRGERALVAFEGALLGAEGTEIASGRLSFQLFEAAAPAASEPAPPDHRGTDDA